MDTDLDTDKIFAALADKNRRKIIELLHKKETTLLELSESFDFSFQALSKHLKVLESAQLIQKEKQGKYRIISLKRDSLKAPLEWISFYANFWNKSFDKLDELINKANDNAK